MSFDPSLLVEKLSKLNESTDSIQTNSKWMQHHVRNAKSIASVWADFTIKQAPISQYLALIYVANDVMQRTKRKTDAFSLEFAKHIPIVFPHVYRQLNSDLRAKVVRVVNILKERHCLPDKTFHDLRKTLESIALPPLPISTAASSALSNANTATTSDPRFRVPTQSASALRTSVPSSLAPAPPPPLSPTSNDPILAIARDIVECKNVVATVLDSKSLAAMSPAQIRALLSPDFLKKYRTAVKALEFVFGQQTSNLQKVDELLADLDRPMRISPGSLPAYSPSAPKHARNGDHATHDDDPREWKRPRTSPPPSASQLSGQATRTLPSAFDHFPSMTPSSDGSGMFAPAHAPAPALAFPASTAAAAAAGPPASSSPVPDPMELLKKLTASAASGVAAGAASPFHILGSAASPSAPLSSSSAALAATGASDADSGAAAAFDPMHFLAMSPPPSSSTSHVSGYMDTAGMGAASAGPPPPPLPPGLDVGGGGGIAGYVPVPTVLGSAAVPAAAAAANGKRGQGA